MSNKMHKVQPGHYRTVRCSASGHTVQVELTKGRDYWYLSLYGLKQVRPGFSEPNKLLATESFSTKRDAIANLDWLLNKH